MSRTSTATRARSDPVINLWWAEATEIGLRVDPTAKPTMLQWQADGERMLALEKRLPWLIGDWINYGEKRWGETYAQAMDATKYSYSRLSTFAYVCRAIEYKRRHPALFFGHHELVAPLPPAEQDEWLKHAAAKGWSIQDLRQAMAINTPSSDPEWYWLERIVRTLDQAVREVGRIRLTESGLGPVIDEAREKLGGALEQVRAKRRPGS